MKQKKTGATLIDSLKLKLIEVATDYVKKNLEKSQKQILKYVENHIEKKIKKEVRKTLNKAIGLIILSIASIFLLFAITSITLYLLNIPQIFSTLIVGFILLFCGIYIYYFKK